MLVRRGVGGDGGALDLGGVRVGGGEHGGGGLLLLLLLLLHRLMLLLHLLLELLLHGLVVLLPLLLLLHGWWWQLWRRLLLLRDERLGRDQRLGVLGLGGLEHLDAVALELDQAVVVVVELVARVVGAVVVRALEHGAVRVVGILLQRRSDRLAD